jgi:hypothetical protein
MPPTAIISIDDFQIDDQRVRRESTSQMSDHLAHAARIALDLRAQRCRQRCYCL